MEFEVGVDSISVNVVDSFVDYRDASLQRTVDAVESRVSRVEDVVGNLDRRRQRRRHDALDRLGIGRRDAASVAGAVNVRRENAAVEKFHTR